jgi:hypothetical protein
MNPYNPDNPTPPPFPTVEDPPWQRARLARWCAEWELHRALRVDISSGASDGDTPAPGSVPASPPPGLVAPFDTADAGFRAGAIRLLAHDLTRPDCRPLFVLILGPKGESESELWIAPFGPFLEPASPGEWQTGEEDPDFAVLCPWNARVVHRDWLARTWHTGALDAEQVTDALAVLRHTLLGDRLPSRLRAQVGPPINSLDDPRCAYQAEEMSIFTAFDAQMLDELKAEPLVPPKHPGSVERISRHLGTEFRKLSQARFESPDGIRLLSLSSKAYDAPGGQQRYWFGFRPSQRQYLQAVSEAWVALECGQPEKTLIFPFGDFQRFLPSRAKAPDSHSHVRLCTKGDQIILMLPETGERRDVTDYILPHRERAGD